MMGGQQVEGRGPGDDGYDEDGYDESQRAEILEATRDGRNDGTVILDLDPDLGGDIDEPDEDDQTDLQDDFDAENSDDATLDADNDVAPGR